MQKLEPLLYENIDFTLFLLLIFLSFSCKKLLVNPKDKLPPATQVGKNTFGCVINKEPYIASETIFGHVSPVRATYYPSGKETQKEAYLVIQGIDARYDLPIAGDLGIQMVGVTGEGTYQLISQKCEEYYKCDHVFYFNSDDNTTYEATSGKLVITKFDKVQQIISGTFEFEAAASNNRKVKVTAGRFDIKYSVY
ncbi:DUF6252 family protein [Pontibacter fetidus]|uniref:Uncharacterized protein n=1 Tax=Pontibacter fetidus TaxID=2700082 RepID=A0A6B2H1W9_9BACT|nr:DUF6252 family protein [Pontibacter fetidus]NDK56371.1 hypothetical protein [Pontibacter fetidus]